MKKLSLIAIGIFALLTDISAQYKSKLPEKEWVDSVFNSLSKDEKIAQLMVLRAHSNLGPDHVQKLVSDIRKHNPGALCFFQGGPVRQANLTNMYQSLAKTPLMITIDGEWGVGMRLDSVSKLPYQLTLGAMNDAGLVYSMGTVVGDQCRRLGIHVNYAPVVDINNNSNNPVIGYRSFGEDKHKVARFGVAYMNGMQHAGIMACAKHFPGHGDTEVDSHLDLPVINKSVSELDSLELYPFKELIRAGVGSVMIAHLYIPAIDNTANRATSLSYNNVTTLLRERLGFQGLTFTDALEMKGVTKFFPAGEASVQALIAGNDMLCLPEDLGKAIKAVKEAIQNKKITWEQIDAKVRRVLYAKFQLGLTESKRIETKNLIYDLNANIEAIKIKVAKESLTLLSNQQKQIPIKKGRKVAYVGLGVNELNAFGERMKEDWDADVFFFSYKEDEGRISSIYNSISAGGYDVVVIGVHDYSMRPASNYGISENALTLWKRLQSQNAITMVFGNVYAVKNFCEGKNLVACYQDEAAFQHNAADLLAGKTDAPGRLPVTICDSYKYGFGLAYSRPDRTPMLNTAASFYEVDSIVENALNNKVFPGCVVMALHKGEIIYHKAFGTNTYDDDKPVRKESIFDLASVTKISATTLAVMKLYEEGKLNLKKRLGDYLPETKGTNKANLEIEDILLHEAGLVAFIPFYRETIDTGSGDPLPGIYSSKETPQYSFRVGENIYMRNDWRDTIMKRILASPLTPRGKYVYSDNDFIFLGMIVERISGMNLNDYVYRNFYSKMGMRTTGFQPRKKFNAEQEIVPTEVERYFRRQTIRGDVHDPGAAMLGGIAGHAGLFSNAYDLAILYQMLLNGGTLNGQRFLNEKTINKFTAYGSRNSRRGLGFDKPEKDNHKRDDPYPSKLASPETYGHTGFTGTCVWVDPEHDFVFIFLSNRVHPTSRNPLLSQLNVRANIQDAFYRQIMQN